MKRFAAFILNYPKSILAVFGIVLLAAVYPAIHIRTDFNLENFFPRKDPTIRDYQYLEQEFGRDDNVIMVGFKSDFLLTPSVLKDLKTMVDSVKKIPNVEEVRSLWSAENITGGGLRLEFAPYLQETRLQDLNRDSLKHELTNDPFAEGYLVNQAANTTAFYLRIEAPKNNFEIREKIIARLNEILDSHRSKYQFKITGIPYYRNQYVHYLNDEILFYITLSSLLVFILLWVLYRSRLGVVIPMLIVWMTILLTLAIMELTGGYFEVMSSTIAPILLCVGIADSIHLISKYDDARLDGLGQHGSIVEMLVTLGSATFFTSITTAIGFGTLMTSNIVPMKRFGIYTAVGVFVAFLITICLLPAVLKISGADRVFKEKSAFLFRFFNRTLTGISELNRRHYKKIIVACLAVAVALGSGITRLKINGKVFDELGPETEPIRHAEFFSGNLTPPFPMEVIIDTGNENGITDPAFIQEVEYFTDYLTGYEEVDRAISINTLLKETHRAMAPDKYRVRPIPDREDLIAQYLLLLEFNESEALTRFTDFSYRRVRVAANVFDVGSYRIDQVRDAIQSYLDRHFPDSETTLTGSAILSADLNGKIVSSLFKSILLAFVLISIMMALLFRNSRMVMISLIPNLLPLILVAGFMGYAGIDIKSSTAVIFTVAFGIAVDDSIHYLARVRVEMKRGRSIMEALPLTTIKTGKAIVVTSLVLLAGFGSLLTSVFLSTVYMGMLVAITILAALLADLFLLPALFYWLQPDLIFPREEKEPASKSIDESAAGEVLHQRE